uniref:NADH-ubiquinone oxidoreductase chain 2 n=1 Tax=Amblyomma fimbriatum TaxID=65641 RepID=H9M761_9ACAR|nr:NADH dehydrogenase subunit 2 [Amblyomma fimbriatum]AET63078.1 NADH dehydrogenase subunit 2 [Amblyomma fimbriatum]
MSIKIFNKWLIFMTIIITISSSSWFMYWLMMELNLLVFIPLMNTKKKNNSNCMITYFIVQSFSSSVFLASSVYFYMFNILMFKYFMNISILIKLAAIPFHFWLTNLSEMFNYNTLFLILTFQKIIPLFILSLISLKIISFFAMISSIFASMFVINLKIFKKILIFSSISHQGWMMSIILMKSNFWITYIFIYSLIIYKMTKLMKKEKYSSVALIFLNKNSINEKIKILMMMLSLGGMPPFMGFVIKMISILIIMNNNSILIMILIISSIINIFVYLRMMSPNLYTNMLFLKTFTKNSFSMKNTFFNMNILMTIFSLNFLL